MAVRSAAIAVAAMIAAIPSVAAEDPQPPADDPDLILDVGPGGPGEMPQTQDSLNRLVGAIYEGHLRIDGWEESGGNLLADPVWLSYYRRPDGAYLLLSVAALPRKPGSQHGTFRVTDVLLIPPLERGLELSLDCQSQRNVAQKFIAVIRPDLQNQMEWWRDVRQVWSVDLGSGRITPVAPNGIECVNEGWGE